MRRDRSRPTSVGRARERSRRPPAGTPSITSESRQPQIGTPRTKFAVPSIGSTIHCRPAACGSPPPNSSPRIASSGSRLRQVVADHPLDAGVAVGDLGAVGLELHVEILRAVAVDRDQVGFVGEGEGDGEVVGEGGVGHDPSAY